MRDFLSTRRLITIVLLVAAWCAMWRTVSIANVLSGTLLAVAVLAGGLGTPNRGSIRIVPLLRFGGLVALDLVLATVNVAKEVLTPTDYTEESIVAVHLPEESRRHLLLLVVAVTVTPGTAVVDTDPDTGTLYLHLLHHDRKEETVEHVVKLAELACAALPVGDSPFTAEVNS